MKYERLVEGKFYPNSGSGHESNARCIITEKGWSNQWRKGDAQDFLVLKKKAIQIGSGNHHKIIIASSRYYSETSLDEEVEKYNFYGYKYDLIDW